MKDIDDVLRSAGRDAAQQALSTLLQNATPVVDHCVSELAAAPPGRRDELAGRFASILLAYPPVEQETLRKRMAESLGMRTRTADKIIALARKKPERPPGKPAASAHGMDVEDLNYRWTVKGLERVEIREVMGRQQEHATLVANFIIKIERAVELTDGLDTQRVYDCRVLIAGDPADSPGHPLRLDAETFGSHMKLTECLCGAGLYNARCSSKNMDFLRLASSKFSEEHGVGRVRTVEHIGYIPVPTGGRAYVTPSVCIKDGEIISNEEALARLGVQCVIPADGFKGIRALDLSPISDDDFAATVKHINTDLMEYRGPALGRTLLGHAFLAPVFSLLRGFKPYVVFIQGSSGVIKSTPARYFQAFFARASEEFATESWGSTPKAIEYGGHTYKDALYVVDDFKYEHLRGNALSEALRIMQTYTDGAGRNRLSRQSKMMTSTYIRGMLAVTGEDVPESETSNLARMLIIRVSRAPNSKQQTALNRRCDEMSRLHSGVMTRYIAWTQRKESGYFRRFAEELQERFEDRPDIAATIADNKPRVLQNLTLNCLGYALWIDFATDTGLLDAETGRSWVQQHFDFLCGLFFEQVEAVNEERPAKAFLREVKAMLDSGVVRVDSITAKQDIRGGFTTGTGQIGSGDRLVGFYDDDHYYFMHDALYKEVGEYRSRGRLKAGDFSKSSIIRQMFEDGLLVPNPSRSGTNDEKKHRIVLDGSAKYVIKLQREALDD